MVGALSVVAALRQLASALIALLGAVFHIFCHATTRGLPPAGGEQRQLFHAEETVAQRTFFQGPAAARQPLTTTVACPVACSEPRRRSAGRLSASAAATHMATSPVPLLDFSRLPCDPWAARKYEDAAAAAARHDDAASFTHFDPTNHYAGGYRLGETFAAAHRTPPRAPIGSAAWAGGVGTRSPLTFSASRELSTTPPPARAAVPPATAPPSPSLLAGSDRRDFSRGPSGNAPSQSPLRHVSFPRRTLSPEEDLALTDATLTDAIVRRSSMERRGRESLRGESNSLVTHRSS